MQKQVAGMENPLLEAGAFTTGHHRVGFRHQGKLVEPIAGQLMFDFSTQERVVSSSKISIVKPEPASTDVAELFARGIMLEEDPGQHTLAIQTYQRVLELDPNHAAAHINLGTLYYNRQEYTLAEKHYRRAIEVDPRYALAYFDLGNVLDETGRVAEAIQTYNAALQLAPTYADAHYNLALAYEKMKEPRKALKHWRAYVRLDTAGPWESTREIRFSGSCRRTGLSSYIVGVEHCPKAFPIPRKRPHVPLLLLDKNETTGKVRSIDSIRASYRCPR